MILKTEAVVLKSFDFRETSRIATFFTKDYGKVSGVLKGIRKDHRKFGSSVDRFSVNDIVYYQYRNSDLHLISQCDMLRFFFSVRQDLKKSLAASYVLELVSLLMPVEETNPKVYALMLDVLQSLEDGADLSLLVHSFQIKMLLYSGFRPCLDTCLKCRKTIGGKVRFSLNEGGLICRDCPVRDASVHLISQGSAASLLYIERNDWQTCLNLRLTAPIKNELKYVLNNFLVFHLGRKIKSAQYLSLTTRGEPGVLSL